MDQTHLPEPAPAVAPLDGTEGAVSGVERRYKSEESTYYHDYLGLDHLLNAQHRRSEDFGKPAHDEMIFIIVHQTYELWFKEVLFELDAVLKSFTGYAKDSDINTAVLRLERVIEIFKVLVQQVSIVETITPLDFLDFRDYLIPASGFQSMQFRMVEIKLGLRVQDRNQYQQRTFTHYFKPEHRDRLEAAEKEPSLFQVIESWLERTPFVEFQGFHWLEAYKTAVESMLARDEEIIRRNELFTKEQMEAQLKELEVTRRNFETVFDVKVYEEHVAKGLRRMSHRAMQAALLISLYRDEPMFHLPFRVLSALTTIDEIVSQWRYRHMAMVHRIIGVKIGTGGSSGYGYLRTTVGDRYRVFTDITSLSTFMIARSALPELPDFVKQELSFVYQGAKSQ